MRYALFIPLLFASLTLANAPLETTRTIDDQIEALDKGTPIAQEMRKITEQRDEINRGVHEKVSELHESADQLRQSDAWNDYVKQRRELEAQRRHAWQIEREAMAEAARKLYASRHQELLSRRLDQTPQLQSLGLDVLSYPRVNGSTSTHPLGVIIASRSLGVPYMWLYPEPGGYGIPRAPMPGELFFQPASARALPPRRHIAELSLAASRVVAKPDDINPQQLRRAMIINSLLAQSDGTHESYQQLIDGQADLILVARAPSEDERKHATEKGVKLETRPIAMDALVFIVNHQNDLTDLTLDEIRKLYRNSLATNEDINASGLSQNSSGEREAAIQKLKPLVRERNSGSRELFDELVMKGEQLPEPRNHWASQMYASGMGGPFSRATSDKDALGYTVYYYDRFMSMSPYTRTIAIDGVQPTPETISSGAYPLVTPVIAAYRADEPADAPAIKLLNWLLSEEGQAVVRESGYVPAN